MTDLRCRVGWHKPSKTQIHVREGWGFFGGPLVIYRWVCARCGKHGTT